MRFCFVVRSFSPPSQTFVYDRVLALQKLGHEVHIITQQKVDTPKRPYEHIHLISPPSFWEKIKLKSSRYLRRKLSNASHTNLIKYETYYQKSMLEIIRLMKPDIIHAEFGPMGALAAPVAEQLNIPLIVFMHGFDITQLGQQSRWRQRYSLMWSQATHILTPSDYMHRQVIKLGAPTEMVSVQHNGVNTDTWPYSDPTEHFDGSRIRFLFVGRFVDKKAPLLLLKAFAQCCDQLSDNYQPELIMCGNGTLFDQAVLLIKNLGLSARVKLLGAVTHEQVSMEMQMSHIMVQHSVTSTNGDMEGLPVALTEAAATGLPIISTYHSGIPELVRDGVNGYLVKENDVNAMAQRMTDLATAPELWRQFGAAGRELVEEKFAQDKVIERYMQKINKILS